MNKYYTEIKVDTWETARKVHLCMSKAENWAFRGQEDELWDLKTNFERKADNFKTFTRKFNNDYLQKETFIIENFKRRAHFYLKFLPKDNNLIEWLSLIQHYGGPTRLLDFSSSFYVAAFFAMEFSLTDCAIWAINLNSISDACEKLAVSIDKNKFYDDEEYFDNLKFSNYVLNNNISEKMISYATPFKVHERLSIQQGLFLFPCSLSDSFIENLVETFPLVEVIDSPKDYEITITDEIDLSIFNQWPLIKIVIPHNCQNSALDELRNMNISAATLFPGLDGFARSLNLTFRDNVFNGEFEKALKTMIKKK